MSRRYDVCAAVVSHLPYDARVWKEARSLARGGYSVALIGCRYDITSVVRESSDGVDSVEIPFGSRGRMSNARRALTAIQLWLEILRTPARVYHAHNIHTAPVAWIASRLRRAALVYDAHELYGEAFRPGAKARLSARVAAAAEGFVARRADLVITTNPSRADVLRERHGDIPIELLANVPDVAPEVTPLDPGFPGGRAVLLYQGGVYAQSRAFRETIEAIALLDDVDLVVLGFGKPADLDLIRSWAAERGVADRVHLLPPRPFDELVRTAAAAAVGLVPIRAQNMNHYLGDTNKLHEYLMAGLPVVASDLPEIRRVIESGAPPVGELFDPTSPESIAAAVRRVLDDPERYDARRREARRLALERFNWQVEEQRLLRRYRELASA